MVPHMDGHRPSWLFRRSAYRAFQRLRSHRDDDMAFDRSETHTSASSHRFHHSEHPQASKAGFLDFFFRTYMASLLGKGISDTAPHHHDNYVVSVDVRKPLDAHSRIDKVVKLYRKEKEAEVLFFHNDS